MKKFWIVLGCMLLAAGCSGERGKKETEQEKDAAPVVKTEEKDDIRDVSFVAVGDNLIHGAIFYYNAKGDGTYDFKDIYEHTNRYTRKADIAYINQETICGGTELGLSHYPSFNGPYEVLDAVADAGFDWMAASSNHTLDAGVQGILNQLAYMKEHHPDIRVTGSHATKEESEQLQVITREGVKFGILGYTYGLNGYVLPKGKEYMVDLIDKDKIKNDVEKLKKAQYMVDRIGLEYDGIVSGVTDFGVYVELENTVEGMAFQRDLRRPYVMGEKVRIRVLDARPEERQIDFKLLEEE